MGLTYTTFTTLRCKFSMVLRWLEMNLACLEFSLLKYNSADIISELSLVSVEDNLISSLSAIATDARSEDSLLLISESLLLSWLMIVGVA